MPGNDRPTMPPKIRAYRSPRAWALFLAVLAIGLGVDLTSKYWTFATVAGQPVVLDRERLLTDETYRPIPPHDGVTVVPGHLLNLQLVINHGAVFGLGDGMRIFFIGFTFAALLVGVFVFGRYCTSRTHLATIALALILAGGAGNLYDRVVYGVVRDFLHVFPGRHLPFGWTWPGNNPEIFPWVFNIADVMLLTGMALLMIHLHRLDGRKNQPDRAGVAEAPSSASSDASPRQANSD